VILAKYGTFIEFKLVPKLYIRKSFNGRFVCTWCCVRSYSQILRSQLPGNTLNYLEIFKKVATCQQAPLWSSISLNQRNFYTCILPEILSFQKAFAQNVSKMYHFLYIPLWFFLKSWEALLHAKTVIEFENATNNYIRKY
jgi:hypothetical protein